MEKPQCVYVLKYQLALKGREAEKKNPEKRLPNFTG